MANQKNNNDVINECRSKSWTAEARILRHVGVSKYDRYAGEFPYPDRSTGAAQLSECFSFGDENARDAIVEMFQKATKENGWKDISVTWENKQKEGERWPYELEIKISGPEILSAMDAYPKMAEYFTTVASACPERPGTPWQEYIAGYKTKDEMVFKGGADSQVEKMGVIPQLYRDAELYVVGTHTSKSISLPVAQVEFPRNGTLVTFRDNFHDICVSVDAKFPITNERNFEGVFDTKKPDGYFEGFPKALVHDGYDKNPAQFSFTVGDYPSLLLVLSEIYHQDRAKSPGVKPKAVKLR